MKSFNNGKIYAIICKTTNNIYIGSTTEPLQTRLYKHRYEAKNNNRPNTSSAKCLTHNNYIITCLEKYPCNTGYELGAREALHIIKNRLEDNFNCINARCPIGHKTMVYDLSSLPCPSLT